MAAPTRTPATVDAFIGRRIRERRVALGLTQSQLAKMIGVTYQQFRKYECGTNRVTAGRLYEIAQGLDTPITYFYEGCDVETMPREMHAHDRMLLKFARHFGAIRDEKQREVLNLIIRTLAGR